MLSFLSKKVQDKLYTPNLEIKKECRYDGLEIKSIPESYRKLLIDLYQWQKNFVFLLVINIRLTLIFLKKPLTM